MSAGRPSDARREARIDAAAKILWPADNGEPFAEFCDLIGRSLDAADAVSEPTPRGLREAINEAVQVATAELPTDTVTLPGALWTRIVIAAAGEPLTPPRDAFDLDAIEEYAQRAIDSYEHSVGEDGEEYDDLLALAASLRAERSRAAALEGALRALADACEDHKARHSYDPMYCDICQKAAAARALLAESTPKEPR